MIMRMNVNNASVDRGGGIICPPDNEIWYTTYDGCEISSKDGKRIFGVNMVSNIYENGKGVIKFDDIVHVIGREAFYYCIRMNSIFIPNSVTNIGNEAFENCVNLSSIHIPNSVTVIGEHAFDGCDRLSSIVMPNIRFICANAFDGCHISDIFIRGDLYKNPDTIDYLRRANPNATVRGFINVDENGVIVKDK